MADQKNPAEESPLTSAAKSIGAALGKVAHAVGVTGDAPHAPAAGAPPAGGAPAPQPPPQNAAPAPTATFTPKKRAAMPVKEQEPLADDAFKAEYLGSGTFIIKKPKRNKTKLHQSRTKSPQRGARK